MLARYYAVDGKDPLYRQVVKQTNTNVVPLNPQSANQTSPIWSRPAPIDVGKPECIPDVIIDEIVNREVPDYIHSYLPHILGCTAEERQYFYKNVVMDACKLSELAKKRRIKVHVPTHALCG